MQPSSQLILMGVHLQATVAVVVVSPVVVVRPVIVVGLVVLVVPAVSASVVVVVRRPGWVEGVLVRV